MTAYRVYAPDELGTDGYPHAWHQVLKHEVRAAAGHRCVRCGHPYRVGVDGIMEPASTGGTELAETLRISPRALDLGLELVADATDLFGETAVKRSRRQHWSPCDEQCTHRGPYRYRHGPEDEWFLTPEDEPWIGEAGAGPAVGIEVQALWRILTVHHLDGNKANCRWWNLAALDQRCHLAVQGKVDLERPFILEHSDWFKSYAAGFYASKYLDLELTRSEAVGRMEELLGLERLA